MFFGIEKKLGFLNDKIHYCNSRHIISKLRKYVAFAALSLASTGCVSKENPNSESSIQSYQNQVEASNTQTVNTTNLTINSAILSQITNAPRREDEFALDEEEERLNDLYLMLMEAKHVAVSNGGFYSIIIRNHEGREYDYNLAKIHREFKEVTMLRQKRFEMSDESIIKLSNRLESVAKSINYAHYHATNLSNRVRFYDKPRPGFEFY
ncbi:hypothetical protein GF376_03495 [Candidatus Peregrinibacteria bacterium]|nr:hypothetical protein [Candidatus Peregrinibacteria bacterium]